MSEPSGLPMGGLGWRFDFPVENRFSGLEDLAKLWYDSICNLLNNFVNRFSEVEFG